ncbi:50S ribosomal protein L25 [Neolewinella antarctica]|uniref:Large ribosomal subunit protein bL25 n=1 Tax=Neolewinella antarctica TaxID=442734 RepID=A0ABX0XFK9_9BACT|nr:50S ribosomal protein L25 [Neolewinella antarctica]NJC28021.1 large subunit ribosomal protein L25 [Neolewinella antarctica]
METIQVSGEVRTDVGRKAAKAVRREGLAPAVLYGAGEPVHFTVKPLDLRPLIYSPDFKLAELTVNGVTTKAIVKDYQFHPVSDELMHVDFLALEDERTVQVQVPVRFEGSSPGVRNGGKLQVSVRRVKIKTTPEKLIDHVMLDISKLTLGSAIRVRDIKVSEGVEIMNAPGQPIASVEVPRALRSATTAEEKALEEASEGEGAEGDEAAADTAAE